MGLVSVTWTSLNLLQRDKVADGSLKKTTILKIVSGYLRHLHKKTNVTCQDYFTS